MRGNTHQDLPFSNGLPHAIEVSRLQIAQTTMNDFQAIGRCSCAKVSLVDQSDR
jgi:hypothetical protein